MTQIMKRNILIFALGCLAIIAGLLGDKYLRDEKPELFPSLSASDFQLTRHDGTAISAQDLLGEPTAILVLHGAPIFARQACHKWQI